jgi:hypothetical protein
MRQNIMEEDIVEQNFLAHGNQVTESNTLRRDWDKIHSLKAFLQGLTSSKQAHPTQFLPLPTSPFSYESING